MFDHVQDFILTGVLVVVTLWIVDKFWSTFYHRKRKNILAVLIWILFGLVQFVFECNSGDIRLGGTVINVCLLFGISILGYHSGGRAKYFLLALFYAVWALSEVLVFFLLRAVFADWTVPDRMGVVVSQLLMILFVHILSVVRKGKRESVIPNQYYTFLLLIPLGSVFIAINEFYSKGDTFYPMITISILLLFNVVVLEIYTKLNEIFVDEEKRTVYAQQVGMMEQNTLVQEKMMEGFHEERHNLINKLIVLKSSIEKDDEKGNIITDINKIINNDYSLEVISFSGNSTIDALINFKYAVAREYGITFQLKIFVPADLPIEQCDIGVVLGNAIDNAMEAIRGCQNADRILEISMGVKKDAWITVIKNPYEHELKRDQNGNFLSTKGGNQRHGFGLSSIQRIVEKYQGELVAEAADHVFSVTIVLNLR